MNKLCHSVNKNSSGKHITKSYRTLIFLFLGLLSLVRCAYSATHLEHGPNVLGSVQSLSAPKIHLNASVTIPFGADFDIFCDVSGHPFPVIHWTSVSGPLPHSVHQTGSYLIFRNVTHGVANTYVCSAGNKVGTQKKQIHVFITEGKRTADVPTSSPVAVLPDDNISLFYGEDISITCSITGYPVPSATWYFGNESLTLKNVHVSKNTVKISAATLSNQGKYSCVARNVLGEYTATTHLQVVGIPPLFGIQPASAVTYFGVSVSFRCEVTGLPQPHIYWYFISVSGGTMPSGSTISADHTTLTITNPKESGTVYCIAKNPYGLIDKTAVLLVTLPNAIG